MWLRLNQTIDNENPVWVNFDRVGSFSYTKRGDTAIYFDGDDDKSALRVVEPCVVIEQRLRIGEWEGVDRGWEEEWKKEQEERTTK